MGLFYPFINAKNVRLNGVEAGGLGLETGKHAAPLNDGKEGIPVSYTHLTLQTKRK